jgi:ankyrin repeat protein
MPAAEYFFKSPQLEVALAIDQGDNQRVQALAAKLTPAQLNVYGTEQFTLLAYAGYKAIPESERQLAIVTTLLRAGADPLQRAREPKNGGSILSLALLRAEGGGGPAFLKAVLEGGVSPDSVEYHGAKRPLIFRMASQDTPDSLRLLVERGADVNARDRLGGAPIMSAIRTFALDEINYLLDHGADPKVVDRHGQSFAFQLQDVVNTQQNDPLKRYPKVLALRDRIIRMGVQWPPATELEERDRMRARGLKPITPYGQQR